ncbi:MAG: transcription factor S, partial [Candidatus Korarchaeota archaeon]|nr:transcription factor S [Candidatus Korarchaeota archaeon]
MFCPNCGTLMRPKKVEKELVYICPSCGYEMKRNPKSS